jgi:hypothetical protein
MSPAYDANEQVHTILAASFKGSAMCAALKWDSISDAQVLLDSVRDHRQNRCVPIGERYVAVGVGCLFVTRSVSNDCTSSTVFSCGCWGLVDRPAYGT